MSDKTIYDLELHEEISIDSMIYVLRVPGGWMYSIYEENGTAQSVFVPYSDEFQ